MPAALLHGTANGTHGAVSGYGKMLADFCRFPVFASVSASENTLRLL
jgi:hypothetical protein